MEMIDKKLMLVIKQRAKSRGLTQADLAKELGVSLITIKRWYAGKNLRISNLQSLCTCLGLGLSELFSMVEEFKVESFSYTLEQERFLAAEPEHLALFDLLIGGSSINSLKKKFQLDDRSMTSMLLKLDKIKLIELHPGNKVRLLKKGEPSWNPDGPLVKKFRKQMIENFLGNHDKSSMTFFIHDYLPKDIEQIRLMKNELENFMQSANIRASYHPNETKSFGIYLSVKEFEWNLRDCLNAERS